MSGRLRQVLLYIFFFSEREHARQQAQKSQTEQTSDKIFPDKYMDRSVTPKPEQFADPRSATPKPSQQDKFTEFLHTPTGERTARYVDRTPSINHLPESGYKGSDTGYCSASKLTNNTDIDNRGYNSRQMDTPRLNMAQFDPNKYQDRAQTPSNSSGWSCSASIHSNDPRGVVSPTQGVSDSSPLDMRTRPLLSTVSDSSQEGNEFSLQNTKKVLYFDPDSNSRQASLNEQYSNQYEQAEDKHYSSMPQKQPDFHQNYLYARSNSVDELEIDKPRKKVAGARSNSLDDILDFDESREQRTRNVLPNRTTGNSQRPLTNTSSGDSHRNVNNYNNCASSSQVVKPKTDSQQLGEIGSQLNSARLRPIRQRTRNAVVNILESGEVCLEFVKQKHKEERVVEVFVISSEGTQVIHSSNSTNRHFPLKKWSAML